MPQPNIEPWLSGAHTAIHSCLRPLLFSLEQAQQDLRHWTLGLSEEQVWSQPLGLAPLGFQLRHIAGSVDRLFTYVEGGQLNDTQMAALRSEMIAGPTLSELFTELDEVFERVVKKVELLDAASMAEGRGVGRKQLPTTVIGLLVHIAEHTQRHVGQAILTAKVLTAIGNNSSSPQLSNQ